MIHVYPVLFGAWTFHRQVAEERLARAALSFECADRPSTPWLRPMFLDDAARLCAEATEHAEFAAAIAEAATAHAVRDLPRAGALTDG